ncbi:phage holin family protein [Acetatifactor muris]|uniref:phage holin family protein n=1 Tax=Acetatifactor muris TaxID=879566 RepID=UPI000CD2252A
MPQFYYRLLKGGSKVKYRHVSTLGLKYSSNTFFGLIVTIWFIINEILSILENTGRMGCELPAFLKKILVELKKNINDKGT